MKGEILQEMEKVPSFHCMNIGRRPLGGYGRGGKVALTAPRRQGRTINSCGGKGCRRKSRGS